MNDTRSRGHAGDLVEMANVAASEDEDEVDPNTITAPGGLPHDESLARFEANLTQGANRKKGAKLLDIPALDPDAPPPATEAAPAEKPKRGRPSKAAAAAKADAAPPPQPAAVGGLPDDDEEDLRPAFLRQREEERKAAEPVH